MTVPDEDPDGDSGVAHRPGQAIRQWPDGAPSKTIAWDCGLRRKTRRSAVSAQSGSRRGPFGSSGAGAGPASGGGDDFAGGSGSGGGGGSGSLCGGDITAPSLRSSTGGGASPAPAPVPLSVRCARDGPASGSARDVPTMRNTSGRFMLFTRVGDRVVSQGDHA